jgi:2,3-dihydroxybenzoate-AMP ligase
VYGTAERLLNLTRLDDDDDRILFSSIKVVDQDGREVPDGEKGKLITRGPYTIRGYYNAPAINVRAFTADGFYRWETSSQRRDATSTPRDAKASSSIGEARK